MFRKNTGHLQKGIFGFRNDLPRRQQRELDSSEEAKFYDLILCGIAEEDYSCLYSDTDSRPNAPVNILVSSLILMQKKSYTYEEFFKNLHFNLLTKTALGLQHIDDIPFCPATLFNFQNRLSSHYAQTGENLIEKTFDRLTVQQLKELKLKTDIQRTDSFFAASNIRNYSRLQLLVEVLIRLFRILDTADASYLKELLEPYVQHTSDTYIYKLKASDIPHHLETIGTVYHRLYEYLSGKYRDNPVFQIFERVYKEHFTISKNRIAVKKPDELTSGSLQSPDDIDATYRNKNGKKSAGQLINVCETANPANPVNLIDDVAVRPNNINDDTVLYERIDSIKEKTPDLNELHTDGAYGSSDNDIKLESLQVSQIQTGIKGRTSSVRIEIERVDEHRYIVRCPFQCVQSQPGGKREKACFDIRICSVCAISSGCPAIVTKKARVYYFTKADYLRKKRLNRITAIPESRRKLRNNVEATVAEFTRKMPHKKLKVRGYFPTALFAFTAALAINFGRIFRYIVESPKKPFALAQICINLVKELYNAFKNKVVHYLSIKLNQCFIKIHFTKFKLLAR